MTVSKILMMTAITAGLAFFASCERCHTCVAKDQDGVKRYEYPEMCGSKKDLSAYADKCESEYGKYGYTCTCGETE